MSVSVSTYGYPPSHSPSSMKENLDSRRNFKRERSDDRRRLTTTTNNVGQPRVREMSIEKRNRVNKSKDKWAKMLKGTGEVPGLDSPTPTVSSSSISTNGSSPFHNNNSEELLVTDITNNNDLSYNYDDDDDDDDYVPLTNQSSYSQYRKEQQEQYNEIQVEKNSLSYVEEESDDDDEQEEKEPAVAAAAPAALEDEVDDIGTRLRKRLEESRREQMRANSRREFDHDKNNMRTYRYQAHRFDNYYDNEEDENEMNNGLRGRQTNAQTLRNQRRGRSLQPNSSTSSSQTEIVRPLNKMRVHDPVDDKYKIDNREVDEHSSISKARSLRRSNKNGMRQANNELKESLFGSSDISRQRSGSELSFREKRARSMSLRRSRIRRMQGLKTTDDESMGSDDDNDPRENLRVRNLMEQRRIEGMKRSEEDRVLKERIQRENEQRKIAKKNWLKNRLMREMSAPAATTLTDSIFREDKRKQESVEERRKINCRSPLESELLQNDTFSEPDTPLRIREALFSGMTPDSPSPEKHRPVESFEEYSLDDLLKKEKFVSPAPPECTPERDAAYSGANPGKYLNGVPVYYVDEETRSSTNKHVPGIKLVPTGNIGHQTISPLTTTSPQMVHNRKFKANDNFDPYGDEDDTVENTEKSSTDGKHKQTTTREVVEDDIESGWLDELFSNELFNNISTCVCAPVNDCRMGSF